MTSNPAAMTERLIDAAIYAETASGVYVGPARKEVNEARAAIEAALTASQAEAAALRAERDTAKAEAKDQWLRYEEADCLRDAAETEAATLKQRVVALEAEVQRVQSDREYIIGFNAGWEELITQLRFPTMLRKMWSGAEVQKWIDEHSARNLGGNHDR